MFALYFALLSVVISLVVLHVRDRVLTGCVDRLFIFSSMIDVDLAQAKKFEALGLHKYGKFYRDQAARRDQKIKWEARLYKALI